MITLYPVSIEAERQTMMPSLVMHAKDYSWGGGKDTDATDEATGAEEYPVGILEPNKIVIFIWKKDRTWGVSFI